MQKDKIIGNVAMAISKTFSGLNMNATKYLIPAFLGPIALISMRSCFAAAAFWIIGIFLRKKGKTTSLQKVHMFLLGFFGITGYLVTYIVGLKYTTPVASSIILSLEPIWVFVFAVIFYGERLTFLKISGLVVGIGGACLCMVSKKDAALASDPLLGNMLALASSVINALYLIYSHKLLTKVNMYSYLKWSFLGSACSITIINYFVGWNAPMFEEQIRWLPIAVLGFVLIFTSVVSYILLPIGLKYLKTTVVSMYGYWLVAVAAVVGLITGQDRFDIIMVLSIICLFSGLFMTERGELKTESAKALKNNNYNH